MFRLKPKKIMYNKKSNLLKFNKLWIDAVYLVTI